LVSPLRARDSWWSMEMERVQGPHSANLRRNRRMDAPGTWFVTKSLWPKRPCLIELGSAEVVVRALAALAADGRIVLAAFAVMPDHWHALFACGNLGGQPGQDSLPRVMHSLGTTIGVGTCSVFAQHGVGWENGYHDTRIRSLRQFGFVVNYIEQNPVKRQLVRRPEEWPWSSAGAPFRNILTRPWPWRFEKDT